MSSQRWHLARAPKSTHSCPMSWKELTTRPFGSIVCDESFAYANGQCGLITLLHQCFDVHALWIRIARASEGEEDEGKSGEWSGQNRTRHATRSAVPRSVARRPERGGMGDGRRLRRDAAGEAAGAEEAA